MVLTDIGEFGVMVEGRTVKLRPSFYSMTQLGSGKQIVETFASVMSEVPHKQQFSDALAVVYACAEEDLSEVFGYFVPGERGMTYVPGCVVEDVVIPLAQGLLIHGIIGAQERPVEKEERASGGSDKIDFREYVSLAMAHLGLTGEEAWHLTMTEFVGAMRAKFPQEKDKKKDAPTRQELEQTMDWYEKIELKRKKQQGAH